MGSRNDYISGNQNQMNDPDKEIPLQICVLLINNTVIDQIHMKNLDRRRIEKLLRIQKSTVRKVMGTLAKHIYFVHMTNNFSMSCRDEEEKERKLFSNYCTTKFLICTTPLEDAPT